MKLHNFLIAAFVVFLMYNSSFAQITDPMKTAKDQDVSKQFQTPEVGQKFKINTDVPELFGSLKDATIQDRITPVEDVLDLYTYIVGPNDLFNLGIYGYINQQLPIYVNLEGSLVVPTVGSIKIAGLSLAEAKDKVIAAVRKRYYSSEVSLTLTVPRTFLVKISGMSQGVFQVSSVLRPTSLLSQLYYDTLNIAKYRYLKTNAKEHFYPEMSVRNIQLIRKNGSIVRVDMYKFFMTGDSKYNPYFLEGDVLKISNLVAEKSFVSVNGAVQLPGTYEYAEDDDLETVIGLGRGFDDNAEKDSILVFRLNEVTQKYDFKVYSYDQDKKVKINLFDRIFVKYKHGYQKNITVGILGEINRPGYYPISFKNTTLKEVIELAGGFKPTAYLPLCIVFREYDKEYTAKDTTEILINKRANDLIITDKDEKNFEADIISRRQRVVVDFEKLFKYNDESQNIILEDKDIIYINDDKKIVYVFGQVGQEGYVPFEKGKDYEFYIERAGGYSLAADKGNTRIIKFNSRGWYEPDQTSVQSGDFIYVPKVEKQEFKDFITIVAQIAGIILGVLTTYILIKNTNP